MVDDIAAIHENTTAIGAEIHGFAPLGAGVDIQHLAHTFVADMLDDGIVVSDLVHGGDRNTAEIAVFSPVVLADATVFVYALFGAHIDFTLGAFHHGAVSGDIARKGGVGNLVVVGGGVVDVSDIGVVVVQAIESEDDAVSAFAGIDIDGRDAASEEEAIGVNHHGIDGGDTVVDLIIEVVADLSDIQIIVGTIEAVYTDDEGLLEGIVFNHDEGAIAIV